MVEQANVENNCIYASQLVANIRVSIKRHTNVYIFFIRQCLCNVLKLDLVEIKLSDVHVDYFVTVIC